MKNSLPIKVMLFGLLFSLITTTFAQQPKRYKEAIFTAIDSVKNTQYGEAVNVKGESEKLYLDTFSPQGDTLKKRPLLICIHGGGFVNGDKGKGFQDFFCRKLALRGYVTSTINYRMGIQSPKTDTAYFDAMYRAVQDAKAAVRFFRKNAKKYGIDPNRIFIVGGSAGGMTALSVGYLDQSEVPVYIDTKKLGSLEGTSGNDGYSSAVAGVINCWGSMVDYHWINAGDVPLFSIHGTGDTTVPFDSSFSYHGFKYGSTILHDRAVAVGIPTGIKLFDKAGHNIGKENLAVALEEVSTWLAERIKKGGKKKGNTGSTSKNDGIKQAINLPEQGIPLTIFLDGRTLAQNRQAVQTNTDAVKRAALSHFLRDADKLVAAGKVYSVMDKKQVPPSGDKHDYMSIGPYWWPDPTKANGLPYIRKDGQRNPEYYDITDSEEMDKLEADVEKLAIAYFFTADNRYAELASRLIKAWFLDKETRQNPNLNFGQGIPGINTGRGIGIIETRELYKVIDAAILLQGSKNWSPDNQQELKKWFSDYLTWLIQSPNGIDEADEHNNHGTHYDVQIIAYALFTGQTELAKKQVDVSKQRIVSQLKPDGSQPFELARQTSWGYVNMNLWGFFTLARLDENIQVDLWHFETPDGKSLQKCVDWMVPYAKNEKKWTANQIKKITYEVTVPLFKTAALKYANPAYNAVAKEVDEKLYNSDFDQLIF